jgi:hypothetical protein
VIIFEGPDGSGKTTLAKAFSELSGLPIAERVVSKEARAMVDLKEWTEDNVGLGFQEKIFDRHRLISEFIYGPILRAEQEPGFDDISWVWRMTERFYKLRPIIIYSIPPLETVRANLANDPDNEEVAEWAGPIYTAYLQRAAHDLLHYPEFTLLHDYTDGSSEESWAGLILSMYNERLRRNYK